MGKLGFVPPLTYSINSNPYRGVDYAQQLWTPREEAAFTARPEIQSQSKVIYTKYSKHSNETNILLWVWAERAVLGRAKTALKFKYEIEIG